MSSNVFSILSKIEPRDSGGEPPYDGGMENRIAKLEEFAVDTRDRLTRIESRLDNFERIFSTKEDLHKELHSMTWRIFGFSTVLVAVVYFVVKTVH